MVSNEYGQPMWVAILHIFILKIEWVDGAVKNGYARGFYSLKI